jgi:hypothetical protein
MEGKLVCGRKLRATSDFFGEKIHVLPVGFRRN